MGVLAVGVGEEAEDGEFELVAGAGCPVAARRFLYQVRPADHDDLIGVVTGDGRPQRRDRVADDYFTACGYARGLQLRN